MEKVLKVSDNYYEAAFCQALLVSAEGGIPEFHWSPETIGNVDASYFWGYILTQVPGGFLASYIPANRLFGFAIFFSSCLNLLLPTLTSVHPFCVIVVRVIQVKAGCLTLN